MIEHKKINGLFTEYQKTEITREQLTVLFTGLFKNITLEEFVGLITNKYNACIDYAKLVNGEKVNTPMTLLFNPHRLDTAAKTTNGKTIFNSLTDPTMISAIARVGLVKGVDTKNGLNNVISIGYNSVYYIQDFLAYVPRELCDDYNITADKRVLDPCGGWGGRMIGISTRCNYYECFEPSTRTAHGLKNLYKFIHDINPNFKARVHCLPFEESDLEPESYDFALTSPPYYDTEIYSDEDTNSLNRYSTFEKWCDGFYLPFIQKTMDALKPDSVFILNIGNRKYPLTDVMMSNFGSKYQIKGLKKQYILNSAGIGREKGKGETFYEIRK